MTSIPASTKPNEDARTSSNGLTNGPRPGQSTKSYLARFKSRLHDILAFHNISFFAVGRFEGHKVTQQTAPILKLPVEIIEVIADYLRYFPGDPDPPRSQSYPRDERHHLPPITLDISRFSRVCKYLRWSVEPRLYRDIHVDFRGWVIPGHLLPPYRPPCRLDLLLRTLGRRSELSRYVKAVRVEWPDEDSEYSEPVDFDRIGREFLEFFGYCTSVETLLIVAFPFEFFAEGPKLPKVREVMMGSFPGALRALVDTFPGLQTLYLDLDDMDAFPECPLQHQLKTLHLYVQAPYLINYFIQALEVCGNVTEDLHVSSEGSGFHAPMSPFPITLSPLAGSNLQSLRLHGEGYNILGHPTSDMANLVRSLRSLRHLHMSQPCTIHPSLGFSVLPPSLRTLYLSDYGAWLGPVNSRHAFVLDLSRCLEYNVATVKSVDVCGLTRAMHEKYLLGDLGPLKEMCKERSIPISVDIGEFPRSHLTMGQLEELMPEIRILFI